MSRSSTRATSATILGMGLALLAASRPARADDPTAAPAEAPAGRPRGRTAGPAGKTGPPAPRGPHRRPPRETPPPAGPRARASPVGGARPAGRDPAGFADLARAVPRGPV